jgi:hypothetical protein
VTKISKVGGAAGGWLGEEKKRKMGAAAWFQSGEKIRFRILWLPFIFYL